MNEMLAGWLGAYGAGERGEERRGVGTSRVHHASHDVAQLPAIIDAQVVGAADVAVFRFHACRWKGGPETQ